MQDLLLQSACAGPYRTHKIYGEQFQYVWVRTRKIICHYWVQCDRIGANIRFSARTSVESILFPGIHSTLTTNWSNQFLRYFSWKPDFSNSEYLTCLLARPGWQTTFLHCGSQRWVMHFFLPWCTSFLSLQGIANYLQRVRTHRMRTLPQTQNLFKEEKPLNDSYPLSKRTICENDSSSK